MSETSLPKRKRRLRLAIAAVVVLLASTFLAVNDFQQPAEQAHAADLSKFKPGNIIGDSVFFNKNAMNVSQVQAFLNSKVGVCAAGASCLKSYSQATTSKGADAMCAAYAGSPSESAATIIWKVGQACGINPQVIIVTLQKEQGIVTSNAPTAYMYRSAMGYACPDTAACDSQYYGFFNQVYSAAHQFKRYANPPGTSNFFTWYPVGRASSILFSPYPGCPSSSVFIENQATANLYYYTPYQPNANALAAGYGGSSDKCAAFGNRNFYNYYNDWFGSSSGVAGGDAIDRLYASLGGASGSLGRVVTDASWFDANGGGMVKGYENGAITWTAAGGAYVISGDIRAYYGALGGVAGSMGWTLSPANKLSDHGGGTVQAFQLGAITQIPGGSPVSLVGGMRSGLNAAGGIAGPLGWPTANPTCDGAGRCTQPFQGGNTYSTPALGGYALTGDMLTAFNAQDGVGGALGWPASPENTIAVPSGNGTVQAFENGALTRTAKYGVIALTGAVRTAFNAAGGLGGALGWPTAAVSCDASSICSQTFVGGKVLSNPAIGAFALSGDIAAAYTTLGGQTGALGYPASNANPIAANGGGLAQAFQNGAIARTKAAGAYAITGDIRTVFNAAGGIGGSLGWPQSPANTIPANGGGLVQGYQGGAIASSPAGTFIVSGKIRDAFNAAGGIGGSLGWPTSAMVCTAGNASCSQSFQGGTVSWSTAGGGTVVRK
jgi:uncharacterized protein with LGFP repeats